MSWTIRIKEIKYQNRHVKAIVNENDEIVLEIDMLNEIYAQNIINMHNESISETYKRGLYDGVRIAKEELRSN